MILSICAVSVLVFNSWRGEYSSIADADEEEQQSLLEVGGRSGGRGTSLLDGTEGEGL